MRLVRGILLSALTLGIHLRVEAQTPEPLRGDFDDAILRLWVQPEYPPEAREAKLEGEVDVEFIVEADGHVSKAEVKKSTDEKFDASALAAVKRWVFVSASVEGKAAASGMRATVAFKLAQLQQKKSPTEPPAGLRVGPMPVTKAKLTISPAPDYPQELADRRLPGQVILEFTVEPDGRPSAPKVLWASHAAFVSEALLALEKYKFEPAHQGLLALRAPATQGQMDFESQGSTPEEILVMNQLSVLEPEKFKQLPKPILLHEPIYPRELLLAGESGSAVAEFTVTEQGTIEDVLLKEASSPEFGAALIAALPMWHFEQARFVAEAAAAMMIVNYKFVPPASGAAHRLILALQPGGTGVVGAGGLDERLRPLWRVSPVYPPALRVEKPVGKAMIEFVIDRDGRARLPRVVSASQPEFGWAAAAAVNQWVFARPLRGGQPVDVKVSVPVDFAPPKD